MPLRAQSGIYESIPACVPERVDYYNVFKPICPNAFWYRKSRSNGSPPLEYGFLLTLLATTARDQREGHPQVDWACPAGNKPKYTITFCPIAGAKTGSKNVGMS